MRQLILLRHAHADAAPPGGEDLDRPLSGEGLAEAAAAAHWLKAEGLLPERALCSPARRTRETWAAAQAVLGKIETLLEGDIYEATPGALAALADAHADVERLLIVGHNPGLERLVALLHSGQSGDYRGMPPAGIAVLDFAAGAPIEPGSARLQAFWWP